MSNNNRLHTKSTRHDQSFWTTEQVVQCLKLPNPRPLYMAKARNQPYLQGSYLVFATDKRNRWWFCKIQPYRQANLTKVEAGS